MMNNLFNAIVIAALVGTFVLAPLPQPAPPSSRSVEESAVTAPTIDGGAAKAAIEASGYSKVSGLAKAADGTWRARAYFGRAEVRLTVDAHGRVLID